MKYSTMELDAAISSSNRGTKPAKGAIRMIPGSGGVGNGVMERMLSHSRGGSKSAAAEGDLDSIRQVYRSMEEIVGRRRVVAYVALRQDRSGRWTTTADPAIDRLESLVDQPGIMTRDFLRIDPNFAPLRTHPRFVRLVGGANRWC
jgi:hypothetical protein